MYVCKNLQWSSELLAICRNTKTYLWDITDLDNIVLENTYFADITVIDHNQYIKEPYTFQSNYMVSTTQIHNIYFRPPTKLLEGNIFTGVCPFTGTLHLPPTYLPSKNGQMRAVRILRECILVHRYICHDDEMPGQSQLCTPSKYLIHNIVSAELLQKCYVVLLHYISLAYASLNDLMKFLFLKRQAFPPWTEAFKKALRI